jgi:hypothetical protein
VIRAMIHELVQDRIAVKRLEVQKVNINSALSLQMCNGGIE